MNGKWFRKQMRRVLREEAYNQSQEVDCYPTKAACDYFNDEPVNFELTAATGGRILTVRRNNRKTGDTDRDVYLIPSGEDVGQRVAKILNLELMK